MEALAIVVLGDHATPLVARRAPGLPGVRGPPDPPEHPAPGEGEHHEDDQADRHEGQAHGKAQGGDMATGVLA
jgi:hypothetical protein